MNRIESQVRKARRRIMLGLWGRSLCCALFVALIAATIAIAVPALWVMELDFNQWVTAWLVGALVSALLAATIYSLATAPTMEEVAVEVDKRFGLRERLSSSLRLAASERKSSFGEALTADAETRAAQLDVAEKFALRPAKIGWLPLSLVPVLVIVLLLVEPVTGTNASSSPTAPAAEVAQVKTVAAQLKKQIQQQRRKADAENLQEAKELFERMESNLDKILKRDELGRKDALIALNDLKKELEQRRDQLGTSDQLRKALSQMEGLQAGPAEKVADSIQKGDFGQAQNMIKQLADQVRSGELSEQEKEQLKQQVEQLQKQLEQAVAQHEQQKQDLQQQIDQARREGQGEQAAKLQQKLNELQQKDSQMQQMQQMAEAMNQAAQAMQQGDASAAAGALEQMADQLGDMQSEMSELEDLQSALNDLSQSKDQMRCQSCQGGGCQSCQGNGFGDGQGNGLGSGTGAGDRPEQEGDTNSYDSQVRGQVRQGKAIIAGFADGPNRKGISQEDVKHAIESALSQESEAIENQSLPRTEREHATDYFNRLRDGK